MAKNNSTELLNRLNLVIEQAKEMVSKSPKADVTQNEAVGVVDGFFYSNIIENYRNNLTEDNLNELNISKNDVENIEKEFKEIFNRCNKTLEAGSNKGKIDSQVYKTFKKKINEISKNAYKLILELEKYVNITSCENCISQFNKEIKSLGKELKLSQTRSKEEGINVSIGFEGDGENEG